MPYNPPPLLSLENIKPFASTIASLALLLALIFGVGEVLSWLYPGFRTPVWATMALYSALFFIQHVNAARKAWSADHASLEFEASHTVTKERTSSAFFLAIAALFALMALANYPE